MAAGLLLQLLERKVPTVQIQHLALLHLLAVVAVVAAHHRVMGDLEVQVVGRLIFLEPEVLEIRHQQAHHKEITVEPQHQLLLVAVVAHLQEALMGLGLSEGMGAQEQHHLFLVHHLLMLVVVVGQGVNH